MLIAGLERIDSSNPSSYKGQLDLPNEFDSRQFVANWVARRSVEAKKRKETIRSENLRADGWQVWKDKGGKACIRNLGTGPFVLMFRPKALQQALNKAYGNVSIRRMQGEANGDTVGGSGIDDGGMLSNKVLNQIQKLNKERTDAPIEAPIALNDVIASSGGINAPAAHISTEIQQQTPPRLNRVLVKSKKE